MIRVNMLRSLSLTPGGGGVAIAGGALSPDMIRQIVLKVVVILLFPLGLYIYQMVNLSTYREQIAVIDSKIAELEAKKAQYGDAATKVKKFTDEKAHIDRQLEAIHALMRLRLREVKTLDALQTAIPQQVWIDKLQFDGNLVKLDGYALSDAGLSSLYEVMQNSRVFSQFTPKSQSEETTATGKVKKFSIEFRSGREGVE